MGDVAKWLVILVLGYLAFTWFRNGVHANLGPGEYGNQYPFGGRDVFASGFIPFGRNGNGGLAFSANVPWTN